MVLKCFASINSFKSHHSLIIVVLRMSKPRHLRGKYLAKIKQPIRLWSQCS